MKKIITLLTIGLFAHLSQGQQQEHHSMYMQNNYLVNPAEGGTDKFIDLKIGYRTQWTGFGNAGNTDVAPRTFFLSGHAPINKHETSQEGVAQLPFHGVGGAIIGDVIGPFNVTNVKVSYAYHLPIKNDFILSLGAFGGIKQFSVNEDKLEFSSDPTETDPFANSFKNSITPDISLGIWGYSKNYYIGVATFQLLNSKLKIYENIDQQLTNASESGVLALHHWLTAGYKVKLNEDFFVVPSFVVKYVHNTPLTFDINGKLRYQDKYWVGVSYRRADAVVGLAGFTFKKLIDVGYAYDFTLSNIGNYSGGSHEVILGLRLPNHQHNPPPAQFW